VEAALLGADQRARCCCYAVADAVADADADAMLRAQVPSGLMIGTSRHKGPGIKALYPNPNAKTPPPHDPLGLSTPDPDTDDA
jgi:hypothetical protein